MGEGNWSLGVRGYERTCWALTWATETYKWLSVVAGSCGGPVHFVMSIGGHAVRFYHGRPDNVPPRYRQPSFPELQHALEFEGGLPPGRSLRIAIQNDDEGRPERINLVEINDATGDTTDTFLIPAPSQGAIMPFGAAPEPPASIPPVLAEPVDDQHGEGGTKGKKTGSDDE